MDGTRCELPGCDRLAKVAHELEITFKGGVRHIGHFCSDAHARDAVRLLEFHMRRSKGNGGRRK